MAIETRSPRVQVNVPALMGELLQLKDGPFADGLQRLFISSRAPLLFDLHRSPRRRHESGVSDKFGSQGTCMMKTWFSKQSSRLQLLVQAPARLLPRTRRWHNEVPKMRCIY